MIFLTWPVYLKMYYYYSIKEKLQVDHLLLKSENFIA